MSPSATRCSGSKPAVRNVAAAVAACDSSRNGPIVVQRAAPEAFVAGAAAVGGGGGARMTGAGAGAAAATVGAGLGVAAEGEDSGDAGFSCASLTLPALRRSAGTSLTSVIFGSVESPACSTGVRGAYHVCHAANARF